MGVDEESVGENIMNIYLVRIEWTDDGYVKSSVYLTSQKSMEVATKWVLTQFRKGYPTVDNFRITWAENVSPKLRDNYAVLIYSHGPFGVHDPFCSGNRGKT